LGQNYHEPILPGQYAGEKSNLQEQGSRGRKEVFVKSCVQRSDKQPRRYLMVVKAFGEDTKGTGVLAFGNEHLT